MTLKQFYQALEGHDWFYPWSDDHKVYMRGEADYKKLEDTAKSSGPAHAWLLQQYQAHMCSGEPWGTERQPKPAMPEAMSLNTMIDVRASYEQLAFLPDPAQAQAALMAKIRTLGATTDDVGAEPFMLKTKPALMEAWCEGRQMARDAYQQLAHPRNIK